MYVCEDDVGTECAFVPIICRGLNPCRWRRLLQHEQPTSRPATTIPSLHIKNHGLATQAAEVQIICVVPAARAMVQPVVRAVEVEAQNPSLHEQLRSKHIIPRYTSSRGPVYDGMVSKFRGLPDGLSENLPFGSEC
ncbi:hypothetical protein BDZ89DRAFT_386987 [Hymenopellis radicata]|nr:hypothetical protein BDZ89DRAFT_386987 [Hymenopellis radicata]